MTTDGAAKELKFARDYVGEENSFHCACHLVQLCLGDALDSTKADLPVELQEHRDLVDRLWELMTTLRNHLTIKDAFAKIMEKSEAEKKKAATAITKSQTREWNSLCRLISKMLMIVKFLHELYETEPFLAAAGHERMVISGTDLKKMNMLQFPLNEVKRFTEWAEQRDRLMFPFYPKKVDDLVTSLLSDELFDRVVESNDVLDFGKIFSKFCG
jgi:hypothetical protein